jgi:hypothetical protein
VKCDGVVAIDILELALKGWYYLCDINVIISDSIAMELAQLEALCERLYNSQDSVERAHAESTLKCFSVNTDYISQCQYILDHALTPYALMLASSSLLKQVTEHSLALQLRLDIRTFLNPVR